MPQPFGPVLNHLWQSTMFAACVAALCYALRHNAARTRYWLWLAASLKFLVPFSVLVSLGTRVELPVDIPGPSALMVEQISTSFSPVTAIGRLTPAAAPLWPPVLAAIWAAGFFALLARWFWRWRKLHATVHQSTELHLPFRNSPRVMASSSTVEPGLFGIVRPVLIVPAGICKNLTPEQFESILTHELCHLRYRDNFWAAIHMLVEALFWFHPAVWWIGARLIEERERACDEAVLSQGSRREIYAESILNVCKFYMESPLACAAGVTGADLKKRIKEILTPKILRPLTPAGKIALAVAGVAAIATPLIIGVLRAQTLPPPPQFKFEVASIRPSNAADLNNRLGPSPQGGLRGQNVTTMHLIAFAYAVRPLQIIGGPGWVRSDRFDVIATPDQPESRPAPDMPRDQLDSFIGRLHQRVQALLSERFGLVLRAETRKMPVYALVIAKGGHKLTPTLEKNPNMQTSARHVRGTAATMKDVAFALAGLLERPVIDETGLTGLYDLSMEFAPELQPGATAPADGGGPSIFTAIQDQLGLKLESKRAPAPVFVIEKIEKPSEN